MDAVSLIVSIVERGRGVTMEKLYASRQVSLHLQCAGKGTATSEIMDILGLGSSEKDVVFSFATRQTAARLLYDLDSDLRGPPPWSIFKARAQRGKKEGKSLWSTQKTA